MENRNAFVPVVSDWSDRFNLSGNIIGAYHSPELIHRSVGYQTAGQIHQRCSIFHDMAG